MDLFGIPPPDGPDADLARRIAETLAADARFRRQPVAVQVQNGVAILTGRVESPDVHDALLAEVRQVPGLHDLCDALLITDGETRLREARQFGELAARLATSPSQGTRRGSPAAVTARVVMLAVTAAIVLIEVAGWIAALFGVGVLAWAADVLLRRRKR
ncbi:BON domain-containing protein [Actinoplanes sp. LDG1-01]|uniref:BON domain-containing protein n=2 Tax=Paractinoplanes lichenicola TaxID=2802976 RepID=A0ABS1VYV7_9ACTN|nr:BON domain-containing protein [Actinoplanes lichenicola]